MKHSKRVLSVLLAAALIFAAAPWAAPQPAKAEGEILTIGGDGVTKELVYSRADLEGLTGVIQRHCYSLANNFPTDKTEYASGVPLDYLLGQAGLRDAARTVTFTASDGYRRTFTVKELLDTPRYYFPPSGEKAPVPALVCLQNSADGFGGLEPVEMKLIMGQRAPGEQTNPWFVRFLTAIEVSCDKPDKWPEVTFSRVSGPDGVTLQLLHENINSVKIYYTTDGSEPTVQSAMYNISASYYQPELNKPLLIDKTTTVRAVAIGPGKEDSDVSSITVPFESGAFTDLAGYEWAASAIEALAAGEIVNGVGGGLFDPAGNLTRAMFVTMLGRALNKDAAPAAPADGFPDVDYSSWYGPHVQWAADKEIVNGYPDGTFKPNNILTVEEMIAMAVRAGGLDLAALPGKTVTGASEWAIPYILAAADNGMLLEGYLATSTANGVAVDGVRQAKRAEAAVVVHELMQALG